MIRFFESCIPPKCTSQQKRYNGRTGKFFPSEDLVNAEKTFDELIRTHRPKCPLDGAVSLSVTFVWPPTMEASRRMRKMEYLSLWMTGKPDADNAVKMLQDRLVAFGYITQDSHVSELRVRKMWSSKPGIAIEINELEYEPDDIWWDKNDPCEEN